MPLILSFFDMCNGSCCPTARSRLSFKRRVDAMRSTREKLGGKTMQSGDRPLCPRGETLSAAGTDNLFLVSVTKHTSGWLPATQQLLMRAYTASMKTVGTIRAGQRYLILAQSDKSRTVLFLGFYNNTLDPCCSAGCIPRLGCGLLQPAVCY